MNTQTHTHTHVRLNTIRKSTIIKRALYNIILFSRTKRLRETCMCVCVTRVQRRARHLLGSRRRQSRPTISFLLVPINRKKKNTREYRYDARILEIIRKHWSTIIVRLIIPYRPRFVFNVERQSTIIIYKEFRYKHLLYSVARYGEIDFRPTDDVVVTSGSP